MRIGLLSDTHGFLDETLFAHFEQCDEIWHAGDFGTMAVADALAAFRPLRGVYGNIDDKPLQHRFPLDLRFEVEGLDVYMTHIGGYPEKYPARVKKIIQTQPPKLFICGHSHILKIMPDARHQLLHINPGACGMEGWHKMRTAIRFRIEAGKIRDLELIELGLRARLGESPENERSEE